MRLFSRSESATALSRLLDQERKAILSGEFNILRRLVAEKERLIVNAARDKTDRTKLMELRQKAARNHALLDAAASGIRSVVSQLEVSGSSSLALQTYDSSGQRNACLDRTASMQRRI